jgi:protein-tyrosine-phosphatase
VPDPYYGGVEGFERVLDLIEPACETLARQLARGGPPADLGPF